MKKPLLVALLSVVAVTSLGVAEATHPPNTGNKAIGGSTFCDGTGGPIIGDGSPSQLPAHNLVFGPAFLDECSAGNSTVNLQANGDEDAFNRLADRTREFGAADIPLSTVQKAMLEKDYPQLRRRESEVLQIPLYIDSLAIGYNLHCVPAGQRLSLRSLALSQIFSGVITRWNDPMLVADNTFLASCAEPILLVKKEGYAGTTYNLKDYLSKRNPEWNYWKQPDQNSRWPDRAGFVCVASDDVGMARCINTTPGSLGYVQYATALNESVKMAAVENLTRQLVVPSPQQCSTAASSVITTATAETFDFFNLLPFGAGGDWSAVSLTDPRAGYPICNFGYVYAFAHWYAAYGGENGASSVRTLVDYLLVAVGLSHDPKQHSVLLDAGFTPLPPSIAQLSIQGVESIHMF